MHHDCQDLIRLFDECFLADLNTCLLGGYPEPEYLPADASHPHHRILFTRDYFRSALHEVAHWCVAGPERRLMPDFGYWYAPDGRTAEQQRTTPTSSLPAVELGGDGRMLGHEGETLYLVLTVSMKGTQRLLQLKILIQEHVIPHTFKINEPCTHYPTQMCLISRRHETLSRAKRQLDSDQKRYATLR